MESPSSLLKLDTCNPGKIGNLWNVNTFPNVKPSRMPELCLRETPETVYP